MKLELEVNPTTVIAPKEKTVRFTFSQDPDGDVRIQAHCSEYLGSYCVGFLRAQGDNKVMLVLIGGLNDEYFEIEKNGTIKVTRV